MIRCSAHVLRPLPTARPSSAAAGIACVMAGIFFLTLSDANAKWLGASYHPLQILFLRALIALPVVTALALWLGGRRVLRTGHLRLHLARGAINVVSACCFYLGLNSLPLAEATAIAFAAPLFVTALSVFVLKERVDSRRWLAVLAGFAGVLIIVRPGTDAFQAATLLPLTTAMLYAVMMTTARGISPSEGMLTTTFYIVAGQFLCSILTLPWVWQAPAIGDLPYFAGVALFSTLGLTLITQAFRIAPASVVAPFDYTGLIWATVLGCSGARRPTRWSGRRLHRRQRHLYRLARGSLEAAPRKALSALFGGRRKLRRSARATAGLRPASRATAVKAGQTDSNQAGPGRQRVITATYRSSAENRSPSMCGAPACRSSSCHSSARRVCTRSRSRSAGAPSVVHCGGLSP